MGTRFELIGLCGLGLGFWTGAGPTAGGGTGEDFEVLSVSSSFDEAGASKVFKGKRSCSEPFPEE